MTVAAENQTIHSKIKDRLADIEWRMDSLYYILNEEGEKVKFVRNASQRDFWHNMHWRNILLKDRRRGFSTLIAIFFLDRMLFRPNSACGVVDITMTDAIKKLNKVKFAYDALPGWLKDQRPMVKRATTELALKNGSSLYASTSGRGDTLQYLHISEMGKIAARNPLKAREIMTGAIPAARKGMIFIESTAEGQEGIFFNQVQNARKKQEQGTVLTQQDFKFHFFAWYMGNTNTIDPEGVVVSSEMDSYFSQVEAEQNINLTPGQKAWYVKEEENLLDDMKREYPSSADEAFEGSMEGCIFARQLRDARKQDRLCDIPIEALPVNSFWDIGKSDLMTLWLHQSYGDEHRLIGYYENSGESWAHYRRWLDNFMHEHQATEGRHFAPHDVTVRQFTNEARLKSAIELAADIGLVFLRVPRVMRKQDAIEHAKAIFPSVWFDEARCAAGIKHLDNYRREWNEELAVFRDEPRHDNASHGADSFMTFATAVANDMLSEAKPRIRRRRGGTAMV